MSDPMSLDELVEIVAAEEESAERVAIGHVKPYDTERSNESTGKAQKNKHGVALHNFFLAHPDVKELIDLEWGLKAFMQFGGNTTWYDPPHVIKVKNPRLWARLEELQAFRLDGEVITKALKEGQLTRGDLSGYVHSGEKSSSLQVKPIK